MFNLKKITQRFLKNPINNYLKHYQSRVTKINEIEESFSRLSDQELKDHTRKFKDRIKSGESLDDILIPVFAVVREASKRTLGQRHFDVQLLGGMVLHDGGISEMKTGEGKTLVSTLAVYLNALEGKGVHVITVNDYLAKRDANWMGKIYNFLGLSVGCISNGMDDNERNKAYSCDITYGTNNEFGFDYLRDNMKHSLDQMVQRSHNFAIVDEVDSILIDEARTPLVISGAYENKSDLYILINNIIPKLTTEDFEIDEKSKSVNLSDQGVENSEKLLKEIDLLKNDSLYDIENVRLVHHINQAAKAHKLFEKDKDYIVKDQMIVIIDEFTGRMMEGRRYSEGLHQAIEAKENCPVQSENQTLASITFQNYFRLYTKLGGMTGTAQTEAEEFMDIYGLPVIEIPTNINVSRIDKNDEIYMSIEEKYNAIVDLIKDCSERGQPVLVGTTSIEKSEYIASLLVENKFNRIDYEKPIDKEIGNKSFAVLNARYHEQEAKIIEQAGRLGAITIATNMAGRGTDIQLGGNLDAEIAIVNSNPNSDKSSEAEVTERVLKEKEKVILNGGLYVIGTERHESRRIDNQLRGRSGRQGDPGASKFFLSLQDDLMRIFGSDKMDVMLKKFGLSEGEPIVHPWVNKALEKAQSKIEARNFDTRKSILKFDDVMNDQRKVIFEQRIGLMKESEASETIIDMRYQTIEDIVAIYIPKNAYPEQWDVLGLRNKIRTVLTLDLPIEEWADQEGVAEEEIIIKIKDEVDRAMALKTVKYGSNVMRQIEKTVLLQILDLLWRDHIVKLEHLRTIVGLRGYGQRDPLHEFKTESFELFESLLEKLRESVTGHLIRVEIVDNKQENEKTKIQENKEAGANNAENSFRKTALPKAIDPTNPRTWGKVARNSPCPCNSGLKYKQCHGKNA
jgi:preprotein translocase subunit SecA